MIDVDLVGGEDWGVLTTFLPSGWREQAKLLGAFTRTRRVRDPEMLLRLLMIHLADGRSLRETAAMAELCGFAELSDVALMKRLAASGEWLRWMAAAMIERVRGQISIQILGRRLVAVDGTMIREPGPTGTSWRVHFALDLESLSCVDMRLSDRTTAESLRCISLNAGDIVLADSGFGRATDIRHACEIGADVTIHVSPKNIRLFLPDGSRFDTMVQLRTLADGVPGEWPLIIRDRAGWSHPVRLCAIRKSCHATARAQQRVRKKGNKGGYTPTPHTYEAASYILVVTTLDLDAATTSQVLELYRARWQIELAFKRMKSIMKVGHLPKRSPESIQAWLHGKLLAALLTEAMIDASRSFSPWGYRLP